MAIFSTASYGWWPLWLHKKIAQNPWITCAGLFFGGWCFILLLDVSNLKSILILVRYDNVIFRWHNGIWRKHLIWVDSIDTGHRTNQITVSSQFHSFGTFSKCWEIFMMDDCFWKICLTDEKLVNYSVKGKQNKKRCYQMVKTLQKKGCIMNEFSFLFYNNSSINGSKCWLIVTNYLLPFLFCLFFGKLDPRCPT